MHGCRSVFTLLVNAEVDSMGGIVDCEVGLDTKSSPHRAAITKAQEELRLEYDVREERRRELEFLEKGGNPLDYKFCRATSISVQSTSHRDQLAEHYVISEAKGSFALATSPHGDSVESSDRPAGSMGREPNIADNLLLLSGEHSSSPGREKIVRRTGRRSNTALVEQSSKIDSYRNSKESNDLVIFRLGPRGQAYARRNRSRSSRDSHSNKSPLLASSRSDARDVKESHEEAHTEEHTVSSIIDSKPTSPNIKIVQKGLAFKDQLNMEIDGGLVQHAPTGTVKKELQVAEFDTCEIMKGVDHNGTSVEKEAANSPMQTSDVIMKESIACVGFVSAPPCAGDNIKGSSLDENNMNEHEARFPGGADNNDLLAFRDGGIVGSVAFITSNGEARTSKIKSNSDQVKDEEQLCFHNSEQALDRSLNNEIAVKKSDVSQDDGTHGNKANMKIGSSIFHNHEPSSAIYSKKDSSTVSEPQNSEANKLKLAKMAHEDAILKEARIIEANLKRAGAPSIGCISVENQEKLHWHFVLEEMAWMANDFMQERLWKKTSAAQLCHLIASVGRSKFEQQNLCRKQRNVARTLAKAVMNFWNSVGASLCKGEASSDMMEECDANLLKASNFSNFNSTKYQNLEACGGNRKPGIQRYACRLLHYLSNTSCDPILAEAPRTPDRLKDAGSFGVFWDDQLSEESLFYKVLPGSMHLYRELIQSQCTHIKEEECEASMCNSVTDGTRRIIFEEDEGETGDDIFPRAFDGKFSSRFIHKKRKSHQLKSYSNRYEVGADSSYNPYLDGKSASHSFVIMGKRPGILNASAVPTKRTRTAARQRFISPGHTGFLPVTSKTDVSSGDTASFHDDQSSRHGCSQPQKNFEVDSTVDFERMLPFDSSDIPMKPKKKKKPKHLGYKNSLNLPNSKASSYEQRLQADYMVRQDQRDSAKKRCDGQQFESNGNTAFYGYNVPKKPKPSKRAESPETFTPAGGSMPSPVASQMSNMSNSNKLIRIITNRDRGRKSKGLKLAYGQSGPGNAWSTFEDQALVVLVHDMGLNWELVSDALNSTLHFKCIYRKPIDCKERHKFLMDKSAGDGADSAEDSGSSQPYPSTLPGIPKGSARQLFQRLQGPMEEDIMKSHFEKIILIGRRLHSCIAQDNKHQLKQLTPAHSSHVLALSQACPNNLSGPFLSPIDLADAVNSNTDVVGLGYQGSHSNGIAISSHQGSLTPVLPTSSTNAMLQGTSSTVLGSGLSTSSPPVHAPPRDAQRYNVLRSNTLPIDDQKRLQQYSQNFSGRNLQQSGISMASALPAAVDRGVRMLPSGNGMGMLCGVNRSMSMPRSGFQGVSPAGMLNMVSSNSTPSSNGVGMPNSMGTHSNAVSSSGNTLARPRDALQMLRPGHATDEHRQIMLQEIQLQTSQGNAQSISSFSSPFSNAPASPQVQTVPVQQHQPHQIPQQPHVLGNPNNHSSAQQQAYIRFAKESQLQQRIMPQAQHPYSGSSTISPLQSNSQFQQQSQSSSPVNSIASSQPQQKQPSIPRNLQTSSMISNQVMKQRQRQHAQQQQQQQQPRNLQQQKQHPQQPQQQPKFMKSLGRGTMLIRQNLTVDATQVGGRPSGPNSQGSEKLLVQQSQGFNAVSTGLNSNLQQPSISQKLYSRPHPPQTKQIPPIPSHSDSNQATILPPPTHGRIAQQPGLATPPITQQQRQANQSPTNLPRIILPQSRQSSHDGRIQCINETVQVNQMVPSPSLPKISDSSSVPCAISSGGHWKSESSFETCTKGEKPQSTAVSPENFSVNEAIIPPSSQGLVQRQLSGTISGHGHGVGGQWQQQQLQPTSLPQQQHRQGVQGNLYTRSSNAGS